MARRDVAIKTEGAAELRRALRRMEPELDKELAKEIRDIAERVRDEAQGRAPRLTGTLAESLKVSVTQKRAAIYSTVPYAGLIHWGGTISPRGAPITFEKTEFLSRTVQLEASHVIRDLGDAFGRAARRAGWR